MLELRPSSVDLCCAFCRRSPAITVFFLVGAALSSSLFRWVPRFQNSDWQHGAAQDMISSVVQRQSYSQRPLLRPRKSASTSAQNSHSSKLSDMHMSRPAAATPAPELFLDSGTRHQMELKRRALLAAAALVPFQSSAQDLASRESATVIDAALILSESRRNAAGKKERFEKIIADLQRDTGIKLRVLTKIPNLPGPVANPAIPESWKSDPDTVVLVANFFFPLLLAGKFLDFNVGSNVNSILPPSFWSRLSQRYGTAFWLGNGVPALLDATVSAIDSCIREPRSGDGFCNAQ
eukprot:gnl/TRDRNA2_/TRDRNA2_94589_c0_seq1.p1 gnl/TRDRNA2_/TRDRNA2_94589_c0~~gnl/TRDRNA2_/TRDRNA2_94589_c0_seq1.p1  ORF type:complete len:293 (-),score=36.54 gnl/TRDRNA2_/TRDRNA2_94589_c0_seq1:32-910(-)